MNEEKLNILKNFTLLLVDDEEALLDKLYTVLSLLAFLRMGVCLRSLRK
ncbi:MAG: hypothetical protein Q9M39_01975 [Sulfurovum sp.]|nr:hypothetical protein [Sulfurovum sp.]